MNIWECGSSGKLTTDFSGTEFAVDLVLRVDGKLVALGIAPLEGRETLLARYNADGSIDSTFGSGGKVRAEFFSSQEPNRFFLSHALVMQSDEKLVVGGNTAQCLSCGSASNGDFGLLRFNPDGSLDLSFGSGGKVSTDFGGNDICVSLALQPDGKIVAGGSTDAFNVSDFALARYKSDGSLDRSLGSRGKVVTDFFGNEERLNALAVQANGMIVAAGQAFSPSASPAVFAVARYDSGLPIPTIRGASVHGGKLIVIGNGFDDTAVLEVDGKSQKTAELHSLSSFVILQPPSSTRLESDGLKTASHRADQTANQPANQD